MRLESNGAGLFYTKADATIEAGKPENCEWVSMESQVGSDTRPAMGKESYHPGPFLPGKESLALSYPS